MKSECREAGEASYHPRHADVNDAMQPSAGCDVPQRVRELRFPPSGAVAVFDADGTLWHGDVSEDFTRWMIARGRFDGALWPEYERVNAADPAAGCFFILRFYEGVPMAKVQASVAEYWQAAPERRWIAPVVAALRWAAQHGAVVHVVSGTPTPVLEPLPRLLPLAGVLALDLEVDAQGRATGRAAGTPSVGEGKCTRVLAATPRPVLLAAGNSALDVPLLRMSRGLAWAVNPDAELRQTAQREGWLVTEDGVTETPKHGPMGDPGG